MIQGFTILTLDPHLVFIMVQMGLVRTLYIPGGNLRKPLCSVFCLQLLVLKHKLRLPDILNTLTYECTEDAFSVMNDQGSIKCSILCNQTCEYPNEFLPTWGSKLYTALNFVHKNCGNRGNSMFIFIYCTHVYMFPSLFLRSLV